MFDESQSLKRSQSALTPLEPVNADDSRDKKRKLAPPSPTSNTTATSSDTLPLSSLAKSLPASLHPLLNNLPPYYKETMLPLQSTILPSLLHTATAPLPSFPADLMLGAPTGSGKTLTYLLPLLQAIASSVSSPGAQGLLVVPTISLCKQVHKQILDMLAKCNLSSSIRVLIVDASTPASLLSYSVSSPGWTPPQSLSSLTQPPPQPPAIIITTPRSLRHHYALSSAVSVSLWSNMRFVVLDESDMLMKDSDNTWWQSLRTINLKPPAPAPPNSSDPSRYLTLSPKITRNPGPSAAIPRPARKMLFSATLHGTSAAASKLGLLNPKIVSFGGSKEPSGDASNGRKYILPATLQEIAITTTVKNKLVHLINYLKGLEDSARVLIFCNAADTAHRLARALQLYYFFKRSERVVAEYSASLSKSQKNSLVAKITQGAVNVCVSTDALSRGTNLNLTHVVNYEAPGSIETYVHRCGRTARAGDDGVAATFVVDAGRWWQVRKGCDGGKVEERMGDEGGGEGGVIEQALDRLGDVLQRERKGLESVEKLLEEEEEREDGDDSSSVASSDDDSDSDSDEEAKKTNMLINAIKAS